MAFHTYLLQCADGTYYAGHTDDLERRLGQHQAGDADYTRERRPVQLVWTGDATTREEALAFELQIKGWSRAKKEALIRGDWQAIRALASRAALRDEASTGSASPQDERRSSCPSVRPEEGLSEVEGPSRRAPPPAIILVRPQLAQNIGKAARAMLNFGLTDLRLVAPRDGWPNPDAGPAASGADLVLERATVHETLADAVADCAHVYATTVRRRGVVKPVVTAEEAGSAIRREPGRSAILFGPERSGLETDDVAVARTIVTVPINPEFGSLNLAQAVILVAYEWSKHGGAGGADLLVQPPLIDADPPAPQADLDGLVGQLEDMLDRSGYFFPEDRTPSTKRTLRSVLTKPAWSAQEVRVLRGVLSTLDRPRPSRSGSA